MRIRTLLFVCAIAVCSQVAVAQNTDVLGVHNLTAGSGSQVYASGGTLGCTFCHAPHSNKTAGQGLWNHTLSPVAGGNTYQPYTSTTYHQTGNTKPPLGKSSSQCLSCHDGTVGVGESSVYGKIPLNTQTMPAAENFGTDLRSSHPFSLLLQSGRLIDSPDMAASLATNGVTADPLHKVRLKEGNVECTSCHNPHVQTIDTISQNFLVRDSSNGQMCLSCHDPNRVTSGKVNTLTGWANSIHATATNQPMSAASIGNYSTVGTTACLSCHMPHEAAGTARLLRPAQPSQTGVDASTQPCLTCHSGGSNLKTAAPNVSAEFAKVGHPYPLGSNTHDALEALNLPDTSATNQVLLNNNRHATCVDCHNPHSSSQVSVFPVPPAIRASQSGVAGISADGTTVLTPAVNQYENCLRCHGSSTGKQTLAKYGYLPTRDVAYQGDQLNVVPQFSSTSTSSHAITQDVSSSALPQPSLRTNMIQLDGVTQGRAMGQRILCTDCHNSDDNREFGGTGPNGPHGSKYSHILERQYQFTQASVAGQAVTTLYPSPDLTYAGPYALCAKCHDLSNTITNASFTQHSLHINTGFSCSVCHTAHGMGSVSATISGERMINFDTNVVAPISTSVPIAYTRSSNTCTLQCHGYNHNADGSVSAATSSSSQTRTKAK